MLGALQFYQGYISPAVRFCVPIFALLALWVGFRRAGFTAKSRTTALVVTGLLVAWYLVTDRLARSGFYSSHWDVMRSLSKYSPLHAEVAHVAECHPWAEIGFIRVYAHCLICGGSGGRSGSARTSGSQPSCRTALASC